MPKQLLFVLLVCSKAFSQDSICERLGNALYYRSCFSTDSLREMQRIIRPSETKRDFYLHYPEVSYIERWKNVPALRQLSPIAIRKLVNKSMLDFLRGYDCSFLEEVDYNKLHDIDSVFAANASNTAEAKKELEENLDQIVCSDFSMEPSLITNSWIRTEGSLGLTANTYSRYYVIGKNDEVLEASLKPENFIYLESKWENILHVGFYIGYENFPVIGFSGKNQYEINVPVYKSGDGASFPSYWTKYTAIMSGDGSLKAIGKVYWRKTEAEKWNLFP